MLPAWHLVAVPGSGADRGPLGQQLRMRALGRSGDEFRSLRNYAPGDDLRRIHWKASSRSEELKVRENEVAGLRNLTVVLDLDAAAHTPESFERAVTAVTSIVVSAAEGGRDVRFLTTGGFDHTPGTAGTDPLLEHLAVVEPVAGAAPGRTLGQLGTRLSGGLLVLAGGQIGPGLLGALRNTASADATVAIACASPLPRSSPGVFLVDATTDAAFVERVEPARGSGRFGRRWGRQPVGQTNHPDRPRRGHRMNASTFTLPNRSSPAVSPALRRRDAQRALTPLALAATFGLLASTLATAFGLCRVFPNWSFFPRMATIAIAIHAVGLVGRIRHWHLATVTAVSAAVTAIVVSAIYQADTTALGVIPTMTTWDATWQAIADSWSQFRVTVAPVPSEGGFGISCAFGIAIIAYVSDAFAFRAYGRAEAVIPGGLLFVVASSLGYDRLRLTATAVWIITAFVAVALLRAAHSEASAPWLGGGSSARLFALGAGGIGIAVVAALFAVVIGPRLPGAQADALIDTRHRSGDGTEVISPLVDIQARLVNRSNVELFTVTTTQPAYLRLTSLEAFDGSQWRQNRTYDDENELVGIAQATGIRQDIEIAALGNIWLPAAFRPTAVEASVDFRFNADSGSIIRDNGDVFEGLDYTVVSELPAATPEQLRSSESGAGPGEEYLELPSDYPDSFRQLAVDITAGAGSAYDQALAIQNWFRANFTYNQNVPRGHSDRAMESFLNQREGYCEQFAGTFAAFARSLGLASRVAVGFTPGDVDPQGVFHVRGKHAHAWPEVWFEDIGWVLFEPTPGRGAPGAEPYTGVAAAQAGGVLTGPPDDVEAGSGDQGGPPTTPAPVSQPDPAVAGDNPNSDGGLFSETTVPNSGGARSGGTPGIVVFVLAILVGLALWMVAMPSVVRARRAARVASSSDRVIASWRDASTAMAFAGAPRRSDETPVEHAERAWRMTGVERTTVRRLAELTTVAAYGPHDPTDDAAEESARLAAELTQSVYRRSTFVDRIRRRLDPRLV